MRCAWLLVALAAPATIAAQTPPTPTQPGVITIGEALHSSIDRFVNLAECQAPGGTVHLGWQIAVNSGQTFPATGVNYTLYASNDATTDTCPRHNGDKGDAAMLAGPVAPRTALSTQTSTTVFDVEFDPFPIASVAGKGACNATTQETIYLCIEGVDPANASTVIGEARVTLLLDLRPPDAPSGVSAAPGDHALNVSWTGLSGTADPSADYYIIDATPVDTTTGQLDPTGIVSSSAVTANPYRLTGLENYTPYLVRVWTFSPADNRSIDPAVASTTVTPLPVNDFWQTYLADGGREQGGCASGPAGLLAIGGAAVLLAVLRRRR